MTKKKAIEAARHGISFMRDSDGCYLISAHAADLCRPLLNSFWDEAFAAGMLHAAKRFMALDGGWRPCVGEIQREARALAKKARAK